MKNLSPKVGVWLVAFGTAALCTGCEGVGMLWLALFQGREVSAHLYSTARLDPVGKLVVTTDAPPEYVLQVRAIGPEFTPESTYAMQFFPWQGCGRAEVTQALDKLEQSPHIPKELRRPLTLRVNAVGRIEQEFHIASQETLFKSREHSVGVALYRRAVSSDGQSVVPSDVLVSCGLLSLNATS